MGIGAFRAPVVQLMGPVGASSMVIVGGGGRPPNLGTNSFVDHRMFVAKTGVYFHL